MKRLSAAAVWVFLALLSAAPAWGQAPYGSPCTGDFCGATLGTNLSKSGNAVNAAGGTGSPGGTSGQIQYNNAGAFGGFTMGGDCTIVPGTGFVTCLTLNGVAPGPFFNGTDAANLTGGPVPSALLAISDNTKTASYAVVAGDMGNALNLGGTGATLTLPVASSTIFAPGLSLTLLVTASGNWTLANSTGLTLVGLPSTTLLPGETLTLVANADGTHLDAYAAFGAPSGVTAGTYGDATHVMQCAVSAAGLVTSCSNVAVSGAGGNTIGAIVTSEFDKTSDTTLAAITGLSLSLTAAKTYTCHGYLPISAPSTGGAKVALATSDTLTVTSVSFAFGNILGTTNAVTTSFATGIGASGAVTTAFVLDATIVVNAGGTLIVEGAQNASNGTATKFLANGYFNCTKIN